MIQRAIHQEFLEFLGDHALGVEVHRQVWLGPVALHAQALEFFALDVDPTCGELSAFLAELNHVHVIFVAALGAILFFDLPFDRQTVAIPTGDIAGILTHHLLGPDNHVFQDLVQRVTDMQMAVRIGWAIMQGELLAGRFGAQLAVNIHVCPSGQPIRFAFWQSGTHREFSAWQV